MNSIKRSWIRVLRSCRRYVHKRPLAARLLLAGIGILGVVLLLQQPTPTAVDHAAYKPLLNTIAMGESKGNYNAYYGNAGNTELRFTEMTISEVMHWQEEYVRGGKPSSAVGKYQIIRPTLAGLVKQLDIETTAVYDEALQDRLAVALLERRGSVAYVEKKLSREEFAANLAKEWAALPKVVGNNLQDSYYAGDGLNQSRIKIDEVFEALAALEANTTL